MKSYLTAIALIFGLSSSASWAAMDESSPCGMMQQQFEQMQGTMGKARKTKDSRSHQQLMNEHMRQMQKGMGMMGGMMHDMMHGGKSGMMQGGKDGKGSMMSGSQGSMMQGGKGGMMSNKSSGMMSTEMMAQQMEHLQQRMDMMQQMMQQLIDHMAEQERMHSKK